VRCGISFSFYASVKRSVDLDTPFLKTVGHICPWYITMHMAARCMIVSAIPLWNDDGPFQVALLST
jgi:hypothetical protein